MIIQGNSRVLPLRDKSVQCVVTSPPYWGLRDYGTGTWEGGDEGCDHLRPALGGVGAQTQGVTAQGNLRQQWGSTCPKCGARRIDSQLGLEKTPQEYVEKMVEVFREVRRVLRDDGTCWINLGDSYMSNPGDPKKRGQEWAGVDRDGLSVRDCGYKLKIQG